MEARTIPVDFLFDNELWASRSLSVIPRKGDRVSFPTNERREGRTGEVAAVEFVCEDHRDFARVYISEVKV